MNTKLIRRTYSHLKGYLKDEVENMTACDFLQVCAALYAMEDLLRSYEEPTQKSEQPQPMEETAETEEEIPETPEGTVIAHWDFTE